MHKASSDHSGLEAVNCEYGLDIEVRQVKYLNNIVEQSHRLIRKMIRPMKSFQNFWSASKTIAGIEIVDMIYRDQVASPGSTAAERFSAFAARAELNFMKMMRRSP